MSRRVLRKRCTDGTGFSLYNSLSTLTLYEISLGLGFASKSFKKAGKAHGGSDEAKQAMS